VQRWMKDAAGDEGSSRVMEDRAKWMEGEMETTERPASQELHHETHK
jgi:hypothetical protein